MYKEGTRRMKTRRVSEGYMYTEEDSTNNMLLEREGKGVRS